VAACEVLSNQTIIGYICSRPLIYSQTTLKQKNKLLEEKATSTRFDDELKELETVINKKKDDAAATDPKMKELEQREGRRCQSRCQSRETAQMDCRRMRVSGSTISLWNDICWSIHLQIVWQAR